MTQEAQLKACPFCGGEATIWKAFPQANYPWAIGVEHTDSCPDAGWAGLCHKTEAEAIAAWNTRIESGVVAELVKAARDLIARKSDTYTARNGRKMGIQADDGEKCFIIHSEAVFYLEGALAKLEASK